MIQFGIKGIECYYSRYSQEEANFLANSAKENNLLISAGSDYHGKNKTVKLAALNTSELPIPNEQITILQEL